ncbi:uncharacterized protein LOC108450777 isoform X6 [Gossypium arboreum]|nr:uncharacterized protein LOC108450777 isoform X6 [Gossypium arboreum]
MSDEGEKTCPLCAEEMDLTDQQLKPCRCGYEICVWCWHHIMDMAEKDDTEGRCPACRSAYDKERIVGTAAKCERMVAEINMERKMKSHKAKTKSSEGRKQLSSVRVIQRNLVYIVGLPLNLADEDLLQRRDYFGQYGKVLKVSMSRTAAGVIQQFPNNTCSVYITYSKEEEAVRCIQSVHGFVLDGRPLKACFGTTKYCHAWLRNVPCSNPDCLYLHEIGSQEDSFTKDEIISAYTRVQQITGATNNMQRRPGNMLPPPADDYCPNSSASAAKLITKSSPNNTTVTVPKSSPPNGSSGRSIALPAGASWGMRALNQPQPVSLACTNGPPKQNSDTVSSTLPFSSAVTNTNQACSLHTDVIIKKPSEEIHPMHTKGKPDLLKPLKQSAGLDCRIATLEKPTSPERVTASKSLSNQLSCTAAADHDDQGTNIPSTITSTTFDNGGQTLISSGEKAAIISNIDGDTQRLCSDMSSTLTLDGNVLNGHSDDVRPSSSSSEHGCSSSPSNQGLQQSHIDYYREPLNTAAAGSSVTSPNGVCVSKEQSVWTTDARIQAEKNTSSEVEEDILSFDNQRLKDPEVITRSSYVPNSPISLHLSNHSRSHSLQHNEAIGAVNLNADTLLVDDKARDNSCHQGANVSSLSNGYLDKYVSSSIGSDITIEGSPLLSNEEKGKQLGRILANSQSNDANDTGESNIISNILSLDFDTWDESLTSPQNLAKLLGDSDKQVNPLKLSSSWKAPNHNQSRFSFARQEDSKYCLADVESSFNIYGQMPQNHPSGQDFTDNRDSYLSKFGVSNGLYSCNFEESDNFSSSPSVFSNKLSAASRAQIPVPPGFSVPSRAPPPGFSSIERVNHAFDATSGNHLMDSSSLLRNSYQAPQSGGIGGPGDIEFIDPAILAVGKGRIQGGLNNSGLDMRSNFLQQLGPYENEARFQLLMQRSLSPHQNLRYDVGDSFSSLNDSYGIPSRLMDQSQVNNMSAFAQLNLQQSRNTHNMSNGHWDGWNEVQGGNGLGVAELLRNERLGFNKFYSGYEDSKYRMAASGDLYNRTFGI